MKILAFIFSAMLSISAVAGTAIDCGVVNINKVLTGPRHGAMMNVSNPSCGRGGWLCLDPDAEHMSAKESDKLFAFILSNHMANKQIRVWAYTDVYATACGNYPIVEDVRTP